jgi:hypothetical protein
MSLSLWSHSTFWPKMPFSHHGFPWLYSIVLGHIMEPASMYLHYVRPAIKSQFPRKKTFHAHRRERRQKAYKWDNYFYVTWKSTEVLETKNGAVSCCSVVPVSFQSCDKYFQTWGGVLGEDKIIFLLKFDHNFLFWELLVSAHWRDGVEKEKKNSIFTPKRIVMEKKMYLIKCA